jgi:diguanylate cyclase (GGDEF)-like protein
VIGARCVLVRSFLDGPRDTTLFHVLAHEMDAAVRSRSVSLAFLDIDDLTGFNDRHGWELGTLLLDRVAETLTATGPHVSAGSFGGDEFAVVFFGTSRRSARARIHRALAHIASIEVVTGDRYERPYASVGGATSRAGCTPADLMRAAHDALVTSKRAGGRRVTWASICP